MHILRYLILFLVFFGLATYVVEQYVEPENVQQTVTTKQIFAAEQTLQYSGAATTKPDVFVQLGHSNDVTAVAFSPDGKLALSGSDDSTTRLWNLQTGKEVAQMVGFNNGEWVTITPKGS